MAGSIRIDVVSSVGVTLKAMSRCQVESYFEGHACVTVQDSIERYSRIVAGTLDGLAKFRRVVYLSADEIRPGGPSIDRYNQAGCLSMVASRVVVSG